MTKSPSALKLHRSVFMCINQERSLDVMRKFCCCFFFFCPTSTLHKNNQPGCVEVTRGTNNEQRFLHPRRQQAPFEAPKVNSRSAGRVRQHAEDEGGVASRRLHPQLICSKNLKFLKQACVALFDHDQAGFFPPSFFLLISHQISECLDLSFLCKPSRAREKKKKENKQRQLRWRLGVFCQPN